MTDIRTFSRIPNIEEAPLENDLMLFDPASSRFFVLNRTMAFVWRECDGQTSMSAIADRMRLQFEGAEPSKVADDLGAALSELQSLGLVRDLKQI
jgi:Coenzyme PQQ synthesis protein D (PqqD)